MSFFLSLLSMMTVLQARVEWVFDFIEIPLYEALEDYRYLPEAKLYIDGFLVVGAEVSYTRNGVERTFISTVNTSIVKNYTIYYKATFPDYSVYSTHPIVFSVVDHIPPVIHEIPEKTMMVGGAFPNFEEGISYSDNYDDTSMLKLSFQTAHITKNIVGIYQYGVIVTDSSGNQTKKVGTLYVVDLIPPMITQKKELIIDVFSTWHYSDYFTISDNADPFLEVRIDDSHVDYEHIGMYTITLYATDASQNQTSTIVSMTVIDRQAPKMILVPSSPTIDVFTIVDDSLLKSYVLDVSDNYDTLTLDDIDIIGVIDTSIIGTYRITYEVKDSSSNVCQMSLDIIVKDRVPPSILLKEDLVIDVFSVEPFWIQFFDIKDNYSSESELTYQLSAKPNIQVIGFYPLTLHVSDKSGNKAIYQGFIEVVDRISPHIIQQNHIIITDFERHNYTNYFQVTDQYEATENITMVIDDSAVDYHTVGEYQIYVYASDRSGNESVLFADLLVIDIIEPTLILSFETYYLSIGEPLLDLDIFIEEVSDNYDKLSFEDVIIVGEINTSKIGKYEIIYQLTDVSGNQKECSLWVTIDDRIPPSLSMDDLYVAYGSLINLYSGITKHDNFGTPQVICLNEDMDDFVPGTYILTYVVMDQRGNYQIYERALVIEPQIHALSLIDFIPIILITCLGGIAALFNYRYYK